MLLMRYFVVRFRYKNKTFILKVTPRLDLYLTRFILDYLANRSYDKTFLKIQIQRAFDILRTDVLTNKPKTQTESTPFVITYNPALPNLAHIIHKHSNVLYSSDRCRNVFKNLPLVAYRRCKNISDILVRAQLTNNTDTSNS